MEEKGSMNYGLGHRNISNDLWEKHGINTWRETKAIGGEEMKLSIIRSQMKLRGKYNICATLSETKNVESLFVR